MCKVAFNHFFSFCEKQCAGNVLDCFRVASLPFPLAVQTLDTRRHLGEPRLKRIRQNLLLFIATRLGGCLPPWSYVTLGNCLPRPHPPTLFHIRLCLPPSLLAFALALWAFALLYSRLFDFSQLCLQLICCCCSTVVLVVVVVVA